MAELGVSVERILAEATAKQLDMFKEEIRQLQALAWQEGYDAACELNVVHINPYTKENL